MNNKCESCSSCGMPMKDPKDFAHKNMSVMVCSHCTDENGVLLSYEAILEGTCNFLINSQGLNKDAAQKLAAELLSHQPMWKKE